jgi:hypothetical protein
MGSAPVLDWLLDMTPVDFVSDSIVLLSQCLSFDFKSSSTLSVKPLCPVFHLCNSAPIHWARFVEWMRKFGYALESLPYTSWRNRLIEVGRAAEKETLLKPAGGAASAASAASSAEPAKRAPPAAGASAAGASPVASRRRRVSSAGGPLTISSVASENALLPLLPIFSEEEIDMGNSKTMPIFDASLTLLQCTALGTPCPRIDDTLLEVYFEFYISSGFLAPPPCQDDQFSIEAD